MEIRLDRISDPPFRWQEQRSIPAQSLERPELLDLSEIAWSGEVSPAADGFLMEARAAYEQTIACARCLAPIPLPTEARTELVLLVGVAEPMIGEHELRESELRTVYLDEPVVDTMPILLEQLELNIPMRVLCQDGCPGLCPVCGSNLNESKCDCEAESIDPRWEALKSLRDNAGD